MNNIEHAVNHTRSIVSSVLNPNQLSSGSNPGVNTALVKTSHHKNRKTIDHSVCTSLIDGFEKKQQLVVVHDHISVSESKGYSSDKPLFYGSLKQTREVKAAIGLLSPIEQLWIKYVYGSVNNKYAEITLQMWSQNQFFELMEEQDINTAFEFVKEHSGAAENVFRSLRDKTKNKIRLLAPFAVRNGAHHVLHGEPLFSSKQLYTQINVTKDNWNKRLAPMWRVWMNVLEFHDKQAVKKIHDKIYPLLIDQKQISAGPQKIQEYS